MKFTAKKIDGHLFLVRENTVDEWVIEEVYKQNPYLPEFLINLIPSEGLVIDVGAHIGCFTAIASKLLKPEIIVSIEPEDNNFELLLENVKILNISQKVKPVKSVLWDSEETLTFYLQNWNTGGHSLVKEKAEKEHISKEAITQLTVNATTLDIILDKLNLSAKPIRVLKIDAEGAEDRVLKGAEKALKRTFTVVGELHESIVEREKIKSLLKEFFVVFGTPIPPLNMLNFWGIRKSILDKDTEYEFLQKAQLYALRYTLWYYKVQYEKTEKELKERTEWAKRLDKEVERLKDENEKLKKIEEEQYTKLRETKENLFRLEREIEKLRNGKLKKSIEEQDAKLREIKENLFRLERKIESPLKKITEFLEWRLQKIELFLKETCLILDTGSYHGVMDTIKYVENRIAPFSEFYLLIRPQDIEKYRNVTLFSNIYLIPAGVPQRVSLLLQIRRRRFKRAVIVYSDMPGVRKFHLFATLSGTKELYVWDGKTPFYRVSKIASLPLSGLAIPLSALPILKRGIGTILSFASMPFKIIYLSMFYLIMNAKTKIKP